MVGWVGGLPEVTLNRNKTRRDLMYVFPKLSLSVSLFPYLPLCASRVPQNPAPKARTASPPNKRSGRRRGMSLGDDLGGYQAQQGNQSEETQYGRGMSRQGNCSCSSGG